MNRRHFLRGTISVMAVAALLKGRVTEPLWGESIVTRPAVLNAQNRINSMKADILRHAIPKEVSGIHEGYAWPRAKVWREGDTIKLRPISDSEFYRA